MAVTLAAGGSLRWWRDLPGTDDYARLTGEAATVPPGAEGLIFLPYLSGERTPHLDAAARGAFVGLTTRHTRAHLVRAIMEGVAFSLAQGLDLIRDLGAPTDEVRAIGGGARSPLWRQILADVLGLPVRRVVAEEGPAYGAALLAGCAVGVWSNVAESAALVRLRPERDTPDRASVRAYAEYGAVYRELYPALRGAMGRLTALASGDDSTRCR
jgi:xylulokinase